MVIASTNEHLSAVWTFDDSGSAYTDNTLEAASPDGTVFTALEATSDYLYFGAEDKFDRVIIDVTTPATISSVTWSYWDGSAWVTFVPLWAMHPANEERLPYVFDKDGAEVFPVNTMRYWTKADLTTIDSESASPPDTIERYWIRVTGTTITQAPTISRVQRSAYNAYCTPDDVFNFLQLDFDAGEFTYASTPSLKTVEDAIYRKQSQIDKRTMRSWRSDVAMDYHNFNLAGVSMINKDVQRVLSVEVWNGNSWEAVTLGRDNEAFFVPGKDAIIFSRFFAMPAKLSGAGRMVFGFGAGEFQDSIRVKYVYGSNIDLDHEHGGMIQEACIKLVAAELMQNADWAKIIRSGVDHVPIEVRVQMWTDQAMEILDQVASRFVSF